MDKNTTTNQAKEWTRPSSGLHPSHLPGDHIPRLARLKRLGGVKISVASRLARLHLRVGPTARARLLIVAARPDRRSWALLEYNLMFPGRDCQP